MTRIVFVTQDVDPAHPALAATVRKIRALARRVDEVVVLADVVVQEALPDNVRGRSFAARNQLARGLRFEAALARELVPRPAAVIAHMCPIYAVLAGPLTRAARVPLALWFSHRRTSLRLRAATFLADAVVSVDRLTFPYATPKLVPIGHGIDPADFPSAPRPHNDQLRVLSLGRTSSSKGIDRIARAAELAGADFAHYGPSLTKAERRLRAELPGVHDAVDRAAVPGLFATHDVLVNDTVAGAVDKVVLEAGMACMPVIASNPGYAELLGDLGLHFPSGDVDALAERLRWFAGLSLEERTRLGRRLHNRVVATHSVDAWAKRLLEVVLT